MIVLVRSVDIIAGVATVPQTRQAKIRVNAMRLRMIGGRKIDVVQLRVGKYGIVGTMRSLVTGKFLGEWPLTERNKPLVEGFTFEQLEAVANPSKYHSQQDKEVQPFLF